MAEKNQQATPPPSPPPNLRIVGDFREHEVCRIVANFELIDVPEEVDFAGIIVAAVNGGGAVGQDSHIRAPGGAAIVRPAHGKDTQLIGARQGLAVGQLRDIVQIDAKDGVDAAIVGLDGVAIGIIQLGSHKICGLVTRPGE